MREQMGLTDKMLTGVDRSNGPLIMGIDAGFASLGAVIAQGKSIVYAGTCHTEKTATKKGIRVADDDTERCRMLARFLLDLIEEWRPSGAVVEMPHGGAQGARANRSMGMATGVVSAVLEACTLPVECVTPDAVKKAATGRRDGSKEEIEAAVRTRFNWLYAMPKTKKDREHVCDSAGALLAAERGTLMRVLMKGA